MIDIRPLKPAHISGEDIDHRIGVFSDFEWRELIELAQRYGFDPPDIKNYYTHQYDDPVEVDAKTSRKLWEAVSAVHHAEEVPPQRDSSPRPAPGRRAYGVRADRRRAGWHRDST